MPPDEERARVLAEINSGMLALVPHNRRLGLSVDDFGAERGEVWMRLPYSEELVGDPDTGLLHGGAITTLMDAACGMAVMVRLGRGEPIATLDLRIDYLKPGRAGADVVAHAECFKTTRSMAFVRGTAHHGDPSDPIAAVAACFVRKAGA